MVPRLWTYACHKYCHPSNIKIVLSDHPFIKYYIFEVSVHFSPRVTPLGIVTQYCKHHNMSYISQLTNNSPWNHAFSDRNSTNIWILKNGIKKTKIVDEALEAILSKQLIEKFNRVHIITACRDKYIIRTNIQENICVFNKIRHIQAVGNKLISLPKKTSNTRSYCRCS